VPDFVMMCDSGPSRRIGWPACCRFLRYAITLGPHNKVPAKAVMTANMLRNVMYLNTLSMVNLLISDSAKKYSIRNGPDLYHHALISVNTEFRI